MEKSSDSYGKVKLWTRQDIRSLEDLKSQGVYRVKKEYIEEQYGDIANHYIKLYRWFVQAAEKKFQSLNKLNFQYGVQ